MSWGGKFIEWIFRPGTADSDVNPIPPKYFARKGDEVICENGHVICEVTQDIAWGALYDPAFFHRWRDPVPTLGTLAEKIACARCGGRWFGGPKPPYALAQRLHFKEGWR